MSFWLLFSAFWALSSAPRLALLVCDRVTGTFTTYKSPVKFSYLDTKNCLSWSWQCCQLNYSSSLWNVQDCATLAVFPHIWPVIKVDMQVILGSLFAAKIHWHYFYFVFTFIFFAKIWPETTFFSLFRAFGQIHLDHYELGDDSSFRRKPGIQPACVFLCSSRKRVVCFPSLVLRVH